MRHCKLPQQCFVALHAHATTKAWASKATSTFSQATSSDGILLPTMLKASCHAPLTALRHTVNLGRARCLSHDRISEHVGHKKDVGAEPGLHCSFMDATMRYDAMQQDGGRYGFFDGDRNSLHASRKTLLRSLSEGIDLTQHGRQTEDQRYRNR